MSNPFVVVGASLAGLRAVEAARAHGYTGPIVLLGAERHPPYDRPPLSKEFLAPGAEVRFLHEEQHLRDDLGVDLRLGQPALALDIGARTVVTAAGPIEYASLVIATGSTPRRLPGSVGRPGLATLRTLDDAATIRHSLGRGAKVVVVGAGFIGSEVASSARRLGNQVTVVEAAAVPLVRAAGPVVGHALAALHARNGTDLRLGAHVKSVSGTDRVRAVQLSDGSLLDADLVLVGIGTAPTTGWLAGSGLELNPDDGGIVCDEYLAAAEGVYAAGDVARWPNPLMEAPLMRLENWTGAAEQGAVAARHALGLGVPTPYQTVPYVWSDWYGSRIQFVGAPAADEVSVVSGDLDGPRFVALYRHGDRVLGAVALNEPGKIMKYRRLIQRRASWPDALDLYRSPAA